VWVVYGVGVVGIVVRCWELERGVWKPLWRDKRRVVGVVECLEEWKLWCCRDKL